MSGPDRWTPGTIVAVEGKVTHGATTYAHVVDSGVPGLDLSRTTPEGQWRLVHHATGILVSRSAVSDDPQALVRLAKELAPLVDWSRRELPVPGPALRQAVEAAAGRADLQLGRVAAPEPASDLGEPDEEPDELEVVRRDLELVSQVLRLIHTSVPPAVLASAIADFDVPDRARLRELLTDMDDRTGSRAVVQPIPIPRPTAPTRQVPAGSPGGTGPKTRPGSAAG